MSAATVFNDDFLDMLRALVEFGVEFMIAGAHALALHGVPRSTGDLDIVVRPTASNAELVIQALEAFGAPVKQHGVTPAAFAARGNVYQLGLPPRRIDLMTSLSGADFEEQGRVVRCGRPSGARSTALSHGDLVFDRSLPGFSVYPSATIGRALLSVPLHPAPRSSAGFTEWIASTYPLPVIFNL